MEKSNDNTVKRIVLSTATDIVSDTSFNPDLSHLSTEQLYAYNRFTEGANLFITGTGGTGKTRLIQHL